MKRVGLDFDNTLIDYDLLFFKTALENELIPNIPNKSKIGVRNYLISRGAEKKFTQLQGEVYGSKIRFADKSDGVFEALKSLKNKGYVFSIVSHKTKYPIIGPKYDLHSAALNWLDKNKFMDKDGLDINKENIFFEPTKEKKAERIHHIGCDFFIDDLKEILSMINNNIIKIHYDKNKISPTYFDYPTFNHWSELDQLKIFK